MGLQKYIIICMQIICLSTPVKCHNLFLHLIQKLYQYHHKCVCIDYINLQWHTPKPVPQKLRYGRTIQGVLQKKKTFGIFAMHSFLLVMSYKIFFTQVEHQTIFKTVYCAIDMVLISSNIIWMNDKLWKIERRLVFDR